jgi:hypothetical protein
MKNILFTLLIFLTVISCTKTNTDQCDNIEQLFDIVTTNIVNEHKYEGIKLPIPYYLIAEQGDTVNFENMTQTKRLVLWFDEESCDQCVLKIFEIIAKQNICPLFFTVIANFKHKKNLVIFKQTNNINYPIYTPTMELGITLENKKTPFLFIVDNSHELKHLFIPEKSYEKGIIDYIKIMRDRFFIQENAYVHADKLRFSFGTIKKNKNALATFNIINLGNTPLIIHNIETTCGCTISQWDKSPVKKNDSTSIYIKYDAKKQGHFNKKIFLHTNSSNSPFCLTIEGNVIE